MRTAVIPRISLSKSSLKHDTSAIYITVANQLGSPCLHAPFVLDQTVVLKSKYSLAL